MMTPIETVFLVVMLSMIVLVVTVVSIWVYCMNRRVELDYAYESESRRIDATMGETENDTVTVTHMVV